MDSTHEPAPVGGPVADRLAEVCRSVAADLAVSSAVVELRSPSGTSALAAASCDVGRAWWRLELDLGEGPATQALLRGRPVLVGDLHGVEAQDWPGYAAAALEHGLRAVLAHPLQVGATRFGVLVLYSDAPRRLDHTERGRALAAADQAVEILLAATGPGQQPGHEHLDPELEGALTFRSEVYQAQGMTMVALRTGLPEALSLMRAHAFAAGRRLDDVAVDIVERRLTISPDPPGDPPPDDPGHATRTQQNEDPA